MFLSVMQKSHIYLEVFSFVSLIQMELFFFNSNGKSWDEKWKWMLEVLGRSPKLQHLTIHEVFYMIMIMILYVNSTSTYLCFNLLELFTADGKWNLRGRLEGPGNCSEMSFISAKNLLDYRLQRQKV
jgi:hypothetical protein